MTNPRVIFVSAVSNEFHNCPPTPKHLFYSYRDVLDQAFRRLAPGYEVVLQENLPLGFGDLLETIEHELSRSLLLIHLSGEMAGAMPERDAIRNLFARHPDLLAGTPALQASVGKGTGISFTQWELYLAFHLAKPRLVFFADAEAPRSPHFAPTPNDEASQRLHRQRITATGKDYRSFLDQGDLARQAIRSFLHFRADPFVDAAEPSSEALAKAWAHSRNIVEELATAIQRPNPRDVPVTDPANVAAFVAAVRAVAQRWQVGLSAIVDIGARHKTEVRSAAEARPTPDRAYDVAFADLALGDFTSGRFWARRAADLAIQAVHEQPEDEAGLRETTLNSLLLLFEHAKGAQDIDAALSAIDEVSAYVDKASDPILWADVNEPFAEFLLAHGKFDRAATLISDLVDVREEHQDGSVQLGVTLVLWAKLLNEKADYLGGESVARRAQIIFTDQESPHHLHAAAAMTCRSEALMRMNRIAEAEPVIQEALNLTQAILGVDHPSVAGCLSHLGMIDREVNRLDAAEVHLRRALEINEHNYGQDHSYVATSLNNLGDLLRITKQRAEAERVLRRSLDIDEKHFGPEHHHVARDLENLGRLLTEAGRMNDAEPFLRRALAVDEKLRGRRHPIVAGHIHNLAFVLLRTKQFKESEALIREALSVWQETLGPHHVNCAMALNSLGHVFFASGRGRQAVSLLRQSLTVALKALKTTGHPGPELRLLVDNYAQALSALGVARPEIEADIDGMFKTVGYAVRSDSD